MTLAFNVMASRQTQAARLGNDVLLQIFYHLDTDESLCVAALVYRSWTIPAQVLLYNTICFGPWDSGDAASFARCGLFARTMHTAPHLTRLVRYLSLHTGADVVREQVEWLHLLPKHGLTRFRYMWTSEHTFDPYVLVAPAVLTVTHFIAHGPQNPSILRACLSLPALETLEVSLADCADDSESDAGWLPERDWGLHAALAPHLHKLIIRMYFVACPAALALFTTFAPQLTAFQLHALFELFAPHREWAAALTSSFSSPPGHVDHLTQLVLSGSLSWPSAGLPFMDAVVRQHRALELVRCPQGSYTSAFFRSLPPSVRILELYHDVDGPSRFAHARALAELLRARRSSQSQGQSALEEVRFLSQYRTTLPLSAGEDEGVVEAAREGGVRLVCVRAGLYTPVGCMPEADVVESSFGSDFCY